MSDTGILELAIDLIKQHASSSGPDMKTVLVLDSELERNHQFYAAMLRRYEGIYIPVDRLSEPRVKGRLDPSLIEAATEVLRGLIGLEVEIHEHRGEVIVGRADGVLPVNESERLMLSFVASLFSSDFYSHELAAVAWTESRLELLAKEAIWQLVRTQVARRRLGSLRTLIFIAAGRVEPEIHCEPELSIRFALTERGLARRKSRVSLESVVGKLSRHSADPFVLFLGAGASVSAGMPLGDEARDYALEHFFEDTVPPAAVELAFRFHDWVRENDRLLASEVDLDGSRFVERLTLERVLREEFRRDGRTDSPTLRYLTDKNTKAIQRKRTRFRRGLRGIVHKTNRLIVVTVNFDTILEDEFGDGVRVFATADSFATARDYLGEYIAAGGRVPVIKLHGTLDEPTSIVADVDTRSLGLSPSIKTVLQLIQGKVGSRRQWVYVGASMRDPDVTEVLGAADFAEHVDEWWVSPLPDPAVKIFADEHRAPRWQKSGRPALSERQITETADTFLSALEERWRV